MTWSIVARDADGALGVAVASRFFAVGVLCAHARTGAGALATQAPILLVDEPTVSLDVRHQLVVMELLRKAARNGGSVLAVVHDLALAARFAEAAPIAGRTMVTAMVGDLRVTAMADGYFTATPGETIPLSFIRTPDAVFAATGERIHQ